jgi:hypothetical protein
MTAILLHDADAREAVDERPLGTYAALNSIFLGLAGGFAAWLRRSGREVPDTVGAGDLALVAVATHKASRLLAKDRVTSALRAPFTRPQGDAGPAEVEEAPRGSGPRRAVGELLICPYCLGLWIASALTAGLLVMPRFVRWVSFALTALSISDLLQIAYRKAEDTL